MKTWLKNHVVVATVLTGLVLVTFWVSRWLPAGASDIVFFAALTVAPAMALTAGRRLLAARSLLVYSVTVWIGLLIGLRLVNRAGPALVQASTEGLAQAVVTLLVILVVCAVSVLGTTLARHA